MRRLPHKGHRNLFSVLCRVGLGVCDKRSDFGLQLEPESGSRLIVWRFF